jgi:surfeit locus 1 family protein
MRFLLALLLGIAGVAVLVALGAWQLERRAWKEGVLARIESRVGADPGALPAAPDPDADDFLPVRLEGRIEYMRDASADAARPTPIRVFGAWRGGSGYRIIVPVATDGRRVMVDLGIVPLDTKGVVDLPDGPFTVTGNLVWPDESGPGTPVPSGAEYYGRDVPDMARFLATEPVLVVARDVAPPLVPRPAPVGTEGIPNNHLGYAIQWFGLALVWAGMTLFLLWRMTRRTV